MSGLGVFAFRPVFMKPAEGKKNAPAFYKYIMWFYPPLYSISPKYSGALGAVGLAMINCSLYGYEKKVLEAEDIAELAKETG